MIRIINVTNERNENVNKAYLDGLQSKWNVRNDWFKIDSIDTYYGLSEVITSGILEKSNLAQNPITKVQDFVSYETAQITFNDKIRGGCVSKEFKHPHEEFWSFSHYFKYLKGFDLQKTLSAAMAKQVTNASEKDYHAPIQLFVDTVKAEGVEGFEKLYTAASELDALTLNNDRHVGNFGFLRDERGHLRLAPIFDNGMAFLASNSSNAGLDQIDEMIAKKRINSLYPYEQQKKICEELYGHQFQTTFSKDDLKKILDNAAPLYNDMQLKRAEIVTLRQLERYKDDLVFDVLSEKNKEIAGNNVKANPVKAPLRAESLSLDELTKSIRPAKNTQSRERNLQIPPSFPGGRD